MGSCYRDLDEAIYKHIASNSAAHPIYAPQLLDMACEELGYVGTGAVCEQVWRLIDRRLQALRRAGRVKYIHKGKKWTAAQLETTQQETSTMGKA